MCHQEASRCHSTCEAALDYCERGGNPEKTSSLADLCQDAILHLPMSSVNVEKLHACTQRNCAANKAGKSADVIQQNSYIMACALEHRVLKDAIEEETLGSNRIRAGRLLRQRAVKQTVPGRTMAQVKPRSANKRCKVMRLGCLGAFFLHRIIFLNPAIPSVSVSVVLIVSHCHCHCKRAEIGSLALPGAHY